MKRRVGAIVVRNTRIISTGYVVYSRKFEDVLTRFAGITELLGV